MTVAATSDGGTGQATVNFTQSGDPLPLWSELVWNKRGVDLDFHLLQAGAPESALGTAPQRRPLWQPDAALGRDPGLRQHLRVRAGAHQHDLPAGTGVYRLYAHYYGGPEPTTAEA
ncbi:MAG: hypothetical protein M5U09_29445 [Gammaproteobacteria bacterium]|nr:hypothetical protein [Gammaproteobacteria bacterium]